MTNLYRVLALAGFAILAGYILWASGSPFWEGVAVVTSNPWGQVTLVDLYLGFFLSALIIFAYERSLLRAIFWAVPIFFLGNIWTALWLAWRAPEILTKLRG